MPELSSLPGDSHFKMEKKKWVKKKASRHFLLLHPTDVVKELVTLHLTVWMFHSK